MGHHLSTSEVTSPRGPAYVAVIAVRSSRAGLAPAQELRLAGWLPDTWGSTLPGTMRWWDGNAWTVDLQLQASSLLLHG